MAFVPYRSNENGTLLAFAGPHVSPVGPLDSSSSSFQPDASAIALPNSSMFSDPLLAPVIKSTGGPNKRIWESHRALIKQLYLEEKKSLTEVMRLMRSEHSFKATVKMYKTYIKQWGLDKKNKEPEMRAIVRKYKQRVNQGKRSIIRVRGQLRNFAEVVRYWERKGVSVDDIVAQQRASPTPEAVVFSTPVPSPIMTPQVLALPERILCCIQDYFKGSFESGTWVRTKPIMPCYSTKQRGCDSDSALQFCKYCLSACSLFSRNQFYDAGQTLLLATGCIEHILSDEDPLSLLYIFRAISHFRQRKRHEISLMMLRQISALGKVLLGSEHPLNRIHQLLVSIYASDYDDVVIRCGIIMTEQFDRFLGPKHWSTLIARVRSIKNTYYESNARIQMLQNLLGECERILQPQDIRWQQINACFVAECFAKTHDTEVDYLIQQDAPYPISSLANPLMNAPMYDLHRVGNFQYSSGEKYFLTATLLEITDRDISIDGQLMRWLPRSENFFVK